MDVAVDKSNNLILWEKLATQKNSLEMKLEQAYQVAKENGQDPEKDQEVKKYRFHLSRTEKAIQNKQYKTFYSNC